MDRLDRLTNWHFVLAGTMLLSLVGVYQFARPLYDSGILFLSPKWAIVVGLSVLGIIVELGLLALSWTSTQIKLARGFENGLALLRRLKALNWLFLALSIALFSAMLIGPYGRYFNNLSVRLVLFWLLSLAGSVFLKALYAERSWLELVTASVLFTALGYRAAAFLPEISAYPFTLNWSEASRYYYASLYLSREVYGSAVPPTVLHPSRYLMQTVPFLISNSPIWLHRAWQVFLWLAATLASASLLAWRLSLADSLRRWMVIAWTFLFLLIGPVYYHLQIPLILMLWGFDPKAERIHFARSLAVLLLASAWAGVSRVNWIPVPAMLAISLYLLEVPVRKKPLWRYLVKPVVWTVSGVGLAFAAQAAYIFWSGNEAEHFTSSFSSDLLWYRLFPNPTYPTGILLAILIVSLPLFLLVAGRLFAERMSFHPVRLLGLGAMLLVLFAGGLVVSVKIGGGSNLHNLDAFLALLLVITAFIFFGRFEKEDPEEIAAHSTAPRFWNLVRPNFVRQTAIAAALLIGIYYSLIVGGQFFSINQEATGKALSIVNRFVRSAVEQGGEVLFISERQLLTFHDVEEVPLIPDYERVFLMEMAMAGNPDYLGRFHEELKNHRFALIVSEPLFIQYKGSAESFGEENDAWVNQVSKVVMCYYEPQRLLRDVRIQLLVPREKARDCQ